MDGVNTYNCRCPPQWTGVYRSWGVDWYPEWITDEVALCTNDLRAALRAVCELVGISMPGLLLLLKKNMSSQTLFNSSSELSTMLSTMDDERRAFLIDPGPDLIIWK